VYNIQIMTIEVKAPTPVVIIKTEGETTTKLKGEHKMKMHEERNKQGEFVVIDSPNGNMQDLE